MMDTVHATAPSENWDDDFEFNPLSRTMNTTTTNSTMIYDKNAHRMSIASSDWDNDDNDHNDDHNNHTNTHMILEDRTNNFQFSPEWIEPGPSTPRRTTKHEENWDDDFEDSPNRKGFPSPPGKDKASPSRLRQKQPQQPRPESWDDEFEAEAEAARASQSDDDMGYGDRDEEDRTVTARSHRASTRNSSSPPPPVPALPLPFLLPNLVPGPSPFPRSPTSSVFSVPSARPPSTAFTVTSTTPLHPIGSRSSSALSGLPPSPPIQRERERRRLRKKSRPPGTAIELTVIRGDDALEYREESEADLRPTTPPPFPQSTPSSPSGNGGAGALLSRIGSVKKWGVRRKKGSTAPSDLGNEDRNSHITPRPHSQASASSIQSSSSSSHAQTHHFPSKPASNADRRPSTAQQSSSSWFFRSASSTYIRGSTSELDLPAQPRTPTKNRQPRPDENTPAKLIKRKSLGFVQLKRGLGVGGHGDSEERGREAPGEKAGQKYGTLGMGRAGDRDRESSRPPDEKQTGEEKDGPRTFMGSMRRLSIVGRHKRTTSGVSLQNVAARLDVVGLGTGLRDENVTPTPESVAASSRNFSTPVITTPTKTSKPPAPALLPPIELQPPSPPRVRPAAPGPDSGKQRPLEPMLLPAASLATSPSSSSLPSSPPTSSASPRRTHLPALGSPQAASLGRSTIGPDPVMSNGAAAMRRSSLGDLKIPDRISQAQVGLRKDMERVREFAAGIEQLKELQTTYEKLVMDVQNILDQQHQQQQQQQLEKQQQLERQLTRSNTPSFFANLPRPLSRHRSNTNPPPPSASTVSLAQSLANGSPPTASAPAAPTHHAYKQLASAYYTIRSKYRISWECAELLIELGSGSNTSDRGPTSSVSVPVMPLSGGNKSGRERAITLGGEDSKPPTPIPGQGPSSSVSSPGVGMNPKAGWRASTGKHDLSQRQLVLLKEILNRDANGAEDSSIPEEAMENINREWRWGKDAMASTVTLPSEDSSAGGGGEDEGAEVTQRRKLTKKRAPRLGMTGLKDMLKSLTRGQDHRHQSNLSPPVPASTTSLSTTDDSSMDTDSHRYPHLRVPATQQPQGRRRAKTSSGPGFDSTRPGRPTSPYSPSSLYSGKSSPRRPSLASIFRLGQKNKPATPELPPELREYNHYHQRTPSQTASTGDDEEDWDRMDDASEDIVLGKAAAAAQDASATVRDTKRKTKPGRSPYLQDTYTPSVPSLPGRPLTPKRSASASHSSIWGEGSLSNGNVPQANGTPPPPLPRATKLSDVDENFQSGSPSHINRPPYRASSRSSFYRPPPVKNGSVRSMPPQPVAILADHTLAMTPENIRPLLENAREVKVKLLECIAEVKALLGPYSNP